MSTLLAPQERAAVVLKDVFDLPLKEIAAMLSTTEGAVKAALHRGRGRLADPQGGKLRSPAVQVPTARPSTPSPRRSPRTTWTD
ncbi:hypothetical protein Shyd_94030 [Streptomyces hydrogenans]|uniref:RNA polymerase sigma factor 70 region 4 type 2 domain-containing protein n=1 Tax=Streptomyces hydrogenans TaxID=1873719 RepID=A0ABQ3PSN8_9ACTN|nr:sigma-70 region 4 domain-containing protein [Streptomyces hydrogenans]GHI28032.1 hypothetical protein Shyd_94030 [Streptomyces hydrogenans]